MPQVQSNYLLTSYFIREITYFLSVEAARTCAPHPRCQVPDAAPDSILNFADLYAVFRKLMQNFTYTQAIRPGIKICHNDLPPHCTHQFNTVTTFTVWSLASVEPDTSTASRYGVRPRLMRNGCCIAWCTTSRSSPGMDALAMRREAQQSQQAVTSARLQDK